MICLKTALLLLLALCGCCRCQEKTYLVTGPREWRIGALETVVVQAFGQEGDLAIRINALSYPDKKTTYATQHLVLNDQNNYQGLVKLMIQPKDFPTYSSSDPMQFIYLQAQSNAFNKEEQVPVSYRNGFLFIQTDKPFYTPDQSVKIRVYSMDEELKPGRRKVVLTFGMWTIEAAYGKDFTTSGTAKFEVKEYVLPKFFVSIEPEKNFICYDKFTEFTITVKKSSRIGDHIGCFMRTPNRLCQTTELAWILPISPTRRGGYREKICSFGDIAKQADLKKLVDNAKVYIRYGLIQDGERTMLPKSIDLQSMFNGESIFQFNSQKAVEELGYSSLEEISGSYLYITVSVEESTGRTEESENVDVKFVLSPYTFKLVGTPLYVKPTLPYYIKVQLRDTMDKPVGNIPLVLSGDMVKEDGTSEPLTGGRLRMSSDKRDGTGVFVLNIPSDISSLDFKITTDDGSLPEDNQATVNHVAVSYQSLTKSYLYINWAREKEVLHVGSFLTIHLVPNSPYIAKLRHYSYLLISKGKILNFGTVQRVEGSDSQSLTLPITSDMVPSVRLLVYYIVTGDATAELVADSIWLDVVESCVNHQTVELSTRETTLKPGQKFNLKVSGPSKSLVALSAVDTAIYDVFRKIEESDLGCGAGAGQNNADVFRLAGLTFLTNANIQASQKYALKCNEVLRPKRSFNFKEEINKKARVYKDRNIRKCCYDGVKCFLEENDCTAGISRVSKRYGKSCTDTFQDCCFFAKSLKEKMDAEIQDVGMGRMYIRTVLNIDEPQIRSYFPESWLWEEYLLDDRGEKTLSVTLPDSLTTWEIQGGCVLMSAEKEICKFSETSTRKGLKECFSHTLSASSLTPFTFTILPLEVGLHPLTFTLSASGSSDIVKKTLRVVPEGIKKERNAGFTLDPQGIRGT
uniref:Anaphylatoxin-like domain-containing protein n=1 Tax=Xenopus tropicalis TaxID=8364 RepID=A0A1B8YA72_XENTR